MMSIGIKRNKKVNRGHNNQKPLKDGPLIDYDKDNKILKSIFMHEVGPNPNAMGKKEGSQHVRNRMPVQTKILWQ